MLNLDEIPLDFDVCEPMSKFDLQNCYIMVQLKETQAIKMINLHLPAIMICHGFKI